MKKTIFSIALVLLISACSPSSKQIQEAIKQTKSAIPTNTETKTLEPTFTLNPSKTSTQAPTSTPLYTSTSDYGKFIYYYKDNFDFYIKKLDNSMNATVADIYYQENNSDSLTLTIKTKCGIMLSFK